MYRFLALDSMEIILEGMKHIGYNDKRYKQNKKLYFTKYIGKFIQTFRYVL